MLRNYADKDSKTVQILEPMHSECAPVLKIQPVPSFDEQGSDDLSVQCTKACLYACIITDGCDYLYIV